MYRTFQKLNLIDPSEFQSLKYCRHLSVSHRRRCHTTIVYNRNSGAPIDRANVSHWSRFGYISNTKHDLSRHELMRGALHHNHERLSGADCVVLLADV